MSKRPTPSELAILGVLWRRGTATVREVHEQLNPGKAAGYTTTLKLLQIMAEKNLVRRDESQRAHVYQARMPREQAQTQLVRELVDKVFGGSASGLVMHALSSKRASAAERAEIRRLLDDMEGRQK
jgi:predicted transcriptional regulator